MGALAARSRSRIHAEAFQNLERALESRRREYVEARSAAYYQVTTEFAAHKNVDKERAKNDLEEHQLVCDSAAE